MAIGLVANDGAGSADGNSVTVGPINTLAADAIFVAAVQDQSESLLTDSEGNTWALFTAFPVEVELNVLIYYTTGVLLKSATHTFTITDPGNDPSACVAAFVGVTSTPDEQTESSGANVEELAIAPITPAVNGSLILSAVALEAGTDIGIFPDMIITDVVDTTANARGLGLAWFEQPTAEAFNTTWNWTGASPNAAAIATSWPPLVTRRASGLIRNIATWSRNPRGR